MELIKKRKFAEFISQEKLEGVGARFSLLSSEISERGIQDDIEVSKITTNKYRPITKEGLDKIDASMKFHHSEKLKGGHVKSAATRVFLCQSAILGHYTVLDGNHRVEYWRSKGSFNLI